VKVDVLLDPFGANIDDVLGAATAAEEAGLDGVWTYDHLAGSVHRKPRVLECWTVLTAIAATVPRVDIGPLVLNVANRHPGVLAVMAATLQEVSRGRLLLGLGAGGGVDLPYAAEQTALGRTVAPDAARRRQVDDAITMLRAVWSGATGGTGGFLRPEPAPPIVIGAFGPKMAAVAGRAGDGINSPSGPGFAALVAVARTARAEAGRADEPFLVTTSASLGRPLDRERLEAAGVDRVILYAPWPYDLAAIREVTRRRRL
jgi:alkanesulfonate monooxygenase SsuD/methylene tetrahydromethanopterin reductase-like flavin-dependent oxidoreductase (luciferase family)